MHTTLVGRIGASSRTSASGQVRPVKVGSPNGCSAISAQMSPPSGSPPAVVGDCRAANETPSAWVIRARRTGADPIPSAVSRLARGGRGLLVDPLPGLAPGQLGVERLHRRPVAQRGDPDALVDPEPGEASPLRPGGSGHGDVDDGAEVLRRAGV